MAVIHDKALFIKASQLIKKGKTHYAFYQMKRKIYAIPLYILYMSLIHFFKLYELNWLRYFFYSILFIVLIILGFFNEKESFLDLIYDYNETIEYYSIHDIGFFDGIEYKKYIVKFTENSYSYSN